MLLKNRCLKAANICLSTWDFKCDMTFNLPTAKSIKLMSSIHSLYGQEEHLTSSYKRINGNCIWSSRASRHVPGLHSQTSEHSERLTEHLLHLLYWITVRSECFLNWSKQIWEFAIKRTKLRWQHPIVFLIMQRVPYIAHRMSDKGSH